MSQFVTDVLALFDLKTIKNALAAGADVTKYLRAADANQIRQALIDIRTYLTDATLTVPVARTITAGTGLTGGGTLAANRTLTLDTTLVMSAGFFDVVLSPTQIAGTTNNWNPGTLGRCTLVKYTSDASRSVTGLIAGADGSVVCLLNMNATGSRVLTFEEENAGSTATNRFRTAGAGGRTGGAAGCVWFRYCTDSPLGTGRWHSIMDTQ